MRVSNLFHRGRDLPEKHDSPRVLILTPVKDAADCLDDYCRLLLRTTYPHRRISLGFLESDSSDSTFADLQRRIPDLGRAFRRVELWKKDFGYNLPVGVHRGDASVRIQRRRVLAKSRNQLLFRALDDEVWVLWLDVDVIEYPPDIIERLLATGKNIIQPHCVLKRGGATFDRNAWRDHGTQHLDNLRGTGEVVELHSVGGAMLLVRADLHRDGLIFPPFLYGRQNSRVRQGIGELETEGLGIMAGDMGCSCWGMPDLEILHRCR
ncbi:MAG: hypothetical protein ACR2JB_05515 [Bryobacteraceae bacterium]